MITRHGVTEMQRTAVVLLSRSVPSGRWFGAVRTRPRGATRVHEQRFRVGPELDDSALADHRQHRLIALLTHTTRPRPVAAEARPPTTSSRTISSTSRSPSDQASRAVSGVLIVAHIAHTLSMRIESSTAPISA